MKAFETPLAQEVPQNQVASLQVYFPFPGEANGNRLGRVFLAPWQAQHSRKLKIGLPAQRILEVVQRFTYLQERAS